MQLRHMFKKTKNNYIQLSGEERTVGEEAAERKGSRRDRVRPEVPEGLVRKCNLCGRAILTEEVREGYYICPKCGGYFRMPAYQRIAMLTEAGSFEEWDVGLDTPNPLQYKGYEQKVKGLREKTGLDEAVVTGRARIGEHEAVIAVMDGRFLMASMGEVTGEKITRAVERATEEKLPVIIVTCSGGARMQEGIVSLMQMAKTSGALKRHSDAGLLYVTVLTDPTTGGVTASFAMQGDVILAEPGALVGFAGPRVIEQTIGQKLPKGFQRAEFLQEHGFVDAVVPREKLKDTLKDLLKLHRALGNPTTVSGSVLGGKQAASGETWNAESDKQGVTAGKASGRRRSLSAWDRVQLSRKLNRPVARDYIRALFDNFVELHGDRMYGDDSSVIGGVACFHGRPVTVIAQAKGKSTRENIVRNFGMPSPEGYRKALRLMKQAEKFHRPVICFVDTPGAFCGIEAEERGQGEAIARNLWEMSSLQTPILSVVIGEGGSGGALALAVADQVWMLENAVYSVLSPEGYAAILWKDSSRAKEAAEVMKLTAGDLQAAGIVEKVFEEPEEFFGEHFLEVKNSLEREIESFLERYDAYSLEELIQRRYQRFRRM